MIPERFRHVALVVNDGRTARRLYLAPWGEAYDLGPGEDVDVYASGPEGSVRVDVGGGHATVWGWPESVIVITKGGLPVEGDSAWERARVPAVPPGLDAREFLELIRPAVDDEDEEGG